MSRYSHLEELVRQVRGGTLQLLDGAPADALRWAPTGTSNHLLWHAGHALWVQGVLFLEPLVGQNELPAGWAESFGMNCRPLAETRDWPERAEVSRLLRDQGDRMLEILATTQAPLARFDPAAEGWDLPRGVVHGLHDEAKHQGEMYLLLKQFAAQREQAT
jgi:hypothetical protein